MCGWICTTGPTYSDKMIMMEVESFVKCKIFCSVVSCMSADASTAKHHGYSLNVGNDLKAWIWHFDLAPENKLRKIHICNQCDNQIANYFLLSK